VKPTLSIKQRIKLLLGMMEPVEKVGMRARAFNNWLKDSKAGWLSGYAQKNVVVFDYYDVLTGHGRSDWSIYGSRDGKDSHPSSKATGSPPMSSCLPLIGRSQNEGVKRTVER
jgi:hypothetical protein